MTGDKVYLCHDCFEDFFKANGGNPGCRWCGSKNVKEYSAVEILDLWRKASEAEEVRYWTVVNNLLSESKDLDPKNC